MSKVLPTKKEVLAHLRADIDAWKFGYGEIDGVVREPEALHAIRCAEMAILMIKDRSKGREINMVEINVEVELVCAECGTLLGGINNKVAPCQSCLDDAEKRGYDRGVQDDGIAEMGDDE